MVSLLSFPFLGTLWDLGQYSVNNNNHSSTRSTGCSPFSTMSGYLTALPIVALLVLATEVFWEQNALYIPGVRSVVQLGNSIPRLAGKKGDRLFSKHA